MMWLFDEEVKKRPSFAKKKRNKKHINPMGQSMNTDLYKKVFKKISYYVGNFFVFILRLMWSFFKKVPWGIVSTVLIVAFAISIVVYSVTASDLPPDSVSAQLASATSEPSFSEPPEAVILSSEDEIKSLDVLGAGAQKQDRIEDIEYVIRSGETLSEIAFSYDIDADILAAYNGIENYNYIKAGDKIKIPSYVTEKKFRISYKRQKTKEALKKLPLNIAYTIIDDGDQNGSTITVQFALKDITGDAIKEAKWDFGDGNKAAKLEPAHNYRSPGVYDVRLVAVASDGTVYDSGVVKVDVPDPTVLHSSQNTRFITLPNPDDDFSFPGKVIMVAGYSSVESSPVKIIDTAAGATTVSFEKPGYYGITVEEQEGNQYYSVFVSPVPSMHVDASLDTRVLGVNWYRTQFNTGTSSNCGPASASMAIGWATGEYFSVYNVRQIVGWKGDGATSFADLLKAIRVRGINDAAIVRLRDFNDLKEVIDNGDVAIILIHTGGISMVKGNPATDLFGKYYNDSVGHYIVVKGYSLDGKYLVINDPIPSDWASNSWRYPDGISMIGRNRYFSTQEVFNSLRTYNMIVVPRKK
ncbi:LysM peptidoglycan-binding domain-containing protein [Spirochaetia bacterium 38H-sp]|uniref:LysM peptidoglycan-binding domain-containing protein n=1 Tax=Rarispira pelagica TaxID=3141764 RepID=A0ABU9UCE1_9SPIR